MERKVTTISQDAFLFSGSVRSNIDPAEKYSDNEIRRVIEQVDLEEKVAFLGGLDGKITEKGGNLSAGQKQLFCLARYFFKIKKRLYSEFFIFFLRALLNKSKLVLIDEATSMIDVHADRNIQEIIRTSLSDCTVLSIQHRLDNIKYFDRYYSFK